MSFFRVPRTTEVTLTKTFYVDEGANDPSGGVTVSVRRLDGTEVQTGAATDAAGTGVWTFALQERATLDLLRVDWLATGLAGANVTVTDWVEIVGAHYFALGEVRNTHADLTTTRFSTAKLAEARISVELECESIRGWAQVPRFARAVVSGSGDSELLMPDLMLRTVRAAWYTDTGGPGGNLTEFSLSEVAAMACDSSGIITRSEGWHWPVGHQNIVVEYEHGADFPSEDVRRMAIRRMRWWATQDQSAMPERAISWQTSEAGGVFRLATPGVDSTGDPVVDAVYRRNQRRKVWISS